MIISSSTIQIEVSKKKKPSSENYFDIREETAVRMFLTASTFDEKNKNGASYHPANTQRSQGASPKTCSLTAAASPAQLSKSAIRTAACICCF